MAVRSVDLKAQYFSIREEIDEAIMRVLRRALFIGGDEVALFESEFADFCGVEEAIGVSSVSDALHLALLACDIGPGDEVITTPLNFVSAIEAICHVKAKPVLVDIDPQTLNLDPRNIEAAIKENTKAIIPAHLYGYPADMVGIMDVARKHGIHVIEDASQGHGAAFKGQHIGTWGHVGCFSFHPFNNLGAFGDAGIVVTDNPETAEKVRLLRNHGKKAGEHLYVGFDSRMDTLQAAVLRVKLSKLKQWNERRRSIAASYRRHLNCHDLELLPDNSDFAPSYNRFVIRTPRRGQLRRVLNSAGIDAKSDIRFPVHLQPAYKYLGYQLGDFPVAEQVAQEIISLPIYPELGDDDVHEIVRCFNMAAPESIGIQAQKASGACKEVIQRPSYL